MNRAGIALAISALVVATAARAESPRWGSFELGAGRYYPNIDSQTFQYADGSPAPAPYEQLFGTKRGWMFRLAVSRALFTYPGSLEVGFKTGYFRMSGNSLQTDDTGAITNNLSGDKTTFNVIPTSVMLTYRFDLLADRYKVPLAPYARVAFERYNWWVGNGHGGSAKLGATNGWSWTGGLALQLDFFDPELARELDRDSGINHTYIFADFTKTYVDDFGSSKSWDLSDKRYTFSYGLMFVF